MLYYSAAIGTVADVILLDPLMLLSHPIALASELRIGWGVAVLCITLFGQNAATRLAISLIDIVSDWGRCTPPLPSPPFPAHCARVLYFPYACTLCAPFCLYAQHMSSSYLPKQNYLFLYECCLTVTPP